MTTPGRIGVLRMPSGNLQSVWNAIHQIGADPVFVDQAGDFAALTHLVMPGVGNFHAVMQQLASRGLPACIADFAASGRPLLGICVGMQLLARSGTEGGETPGLGLVDARVERLPDAPGLRLPHVGWSSVALRRAHPVFEGIKDGRDFYFVHAYAMRRAPEAEWLGATDHGGPFVSAVGVRNILGVQFHPEKSQLNGLRILENFCRWDGRC